LLPDRPNVVERSAANDRNGEQALPPTTPFGRCITHVRRKHAFFLQSVQGRVDRANAHRAAGLPIQFVGDGDTVSTITKYRNG